MPMVCLYIYQKINRRHVLGHGWADPLPTYHFHHTSFPGVGLNRYDILETVQHHHTQTITPDIQDMLDFITNLERQDKTKTSFSYYLHRATSLVYSLIGMTYWKQYRGGTLTGQKQAVFTNPDEWAKVTKEAITTFWLSALVEKSKKYRSLHHFLLSEHILPPDLFMFWILLNPIIHMDCFL